VDGGGEYGKEGRASRLSEEIRNMGNAAGIRRFLAVAGCCAAAAWGSAAPAEGVGCPPACRDGEGVDESEWTFAIRDGCAAILGVPDREGRLDIPETLGGCPVTSIEMEACAGRRGIDAIGIPAGVTSIDPKAFRGCPALVALEVAEDNPAYAAVGGLLYARDMKTLVLALDTAGGDIVIPAGVECIGPFAFGEACPATSVVLPEGLLAIGDFAFCFRGVGVLAVPESVESLGAGAFLWCTGLKTLYAPSTWRTSAILADSGGVSPGCEVVYVPTRAERRYAEWAAEWGAEPGDLPAGDDPDGDGIPNGEECAAGTNPRDAASKFEARIRRVDGKIVVDTPAANPGRVYRVLGAAALVGGDGGDPVWRDVTDEDDLSGTDRRYFRMEAGFPD